MSTKAPAIPRADAKFDTWFKHFVSQISDQPDKYDLDQQWIDDLTTALADWERDYGAHITARDASRAATTEKNETFDRVVGVAQSASRMVQANPRVTDAARKNAGLPVHKTTRTPVDVPATEPVGFVMATDRLEHTLSYADSATPTRRAKPNGVTSCEVYLNISDQAPQNPESYEFHMLSTRAPQRISFKAEDSGKTANYLLRWVNTRGEYGPWSQVISATVPAV